MKPIPFLLLGIAACSLVNVATSADKPPPQNQTQRPGLVAAQEVAAKYDAMAREIEVRYAKLITDAKRRIEERELRINQLKQRIKELRENAKKSQATRTTAREGQQSRGPATEQQIAAHLVAIDREAANVEKEIDKAKDEIKSLYAKIEELEKKKEAELQELRKQKAKAIQDAAR